jgi:hypothetical protein
VGVLDVSDFQQKKRFEQIPIVCGSSCARFPTFHTAIQRNERAGKERAPEEAIEYPDNHANTVWHKRIEQSAGPWRTPAVWSQNTSLAEVGPLKMVSEQ